MTVKANGDGTYDCSYYPTKAGDYVITLSYEGKDAGESPYRVSYHHVRSTYMVT